jgi:hypothetical protein
MVFRTSPKVAVTDDTFGHWLMYFFKFFSIDRPCRLAVGGANHGSWEKKLLGPGPILFVTRLAGFEAVANAIPSVIRGKKQIDREAELPIARSAVD